MIDTGDDTQTGGRLAKIKDYLDDESFCFTYGDGVADINVNELIKFHKNSNCLATLTAVQPPGRYGALTLENNLVNKFIEKADSNDAWINGGFFVLEPSIMSYITSDSTSWEFDVLPMLSNELNLSAYKHHGFWQPMDTLGASKN